MSPRPLQAWKAYVVCSLTYLVVFVPIYLGGNALAARREWVLTLYLGVEQAIPFLPGFIWIYFSMFLLWPIQPLFLEATEIRRLSGQLVAAALIAGVCFLLLPAHLAWPRAVPVDPLLGSIFRHLFAVDRPHNLVPSLHVASSALILGALADHHRRPLLRACWGLWLALIALSTLFTHQHHLLDVVMGLGLAALLRHPLAAARIDPLLSAVKGAWGWRGRPRADSEGG